MALKKKAAVKKKPKPAPAGKAKGTAVSAKKAKKVVKASAHKKAKSKSATAPAKSSKSAKSVTVKKPAKAVKSAKPTRAAKPSKASKPEKSTRKAKENKGAEKTKEPLKPIKKKEGRLNAKAEKANSAPVQKKETAKIPVPVKAAKKSITEVAGKAKLAKATSSPKEKAPSKDQESSKSKKDKVESVDPLHAKAEKVIRELEETMDLSKMRPRIQALTSAPKPVHKTPHTPVRLPEPTNTSKVKFQLEFEFRSSPKILFASISDSSGLAGWFADEVITNDDVYTFIWEGSESHARLVALRDLQLVRFQWLDENDGTYFQFEIKEDDITSDIALIITDFANPGERETNIRLWESQIQKLRMLLGSL